MLLIPAIDLKDGKCVRLKQGRMEDDTVFSDDPVAVASHWVERGARRLHLVDLNGAFAGEPVNGELVKAIAKAHPDLPIQIGGGIRSPEIIQAYLDAGVQWVIIGTKAVNEPQFVKEMCQQFPGHTIVGLDAKDGKVATAGWANVTDVDVMDRSGMNLEQQWRLKNGPFNNFIRLYSPRKQTPPAVAQVADEGAFNVPEGAQPLLNRLRKNGKHLRRWLEREDIQCYRLYDRDLPEFNVAVDI